MRYFTREPPAQRGSPRCVPGDGGPRRRELGLWLLPERPASVRRTRELMRGALVALGFDAETVGDGVVMVSELVTNAIRHARPPYELRLSCDEDTLTCEVVDASPVLPPIPGADGGPHLTLAGIDAANDADLLAGGRGLEIVSRLSGGRCGALPVMLRTSRPPICGKSVWFALDLPGRR
ncbi:MAG TPA: ATP-binding protein [Streptosporangiaceae bacterium]|nr:ATP-binding protein [Streptosporangiaceae bacterium]